MNSIETLPFIPEIQNHPRELSTRPFRHFYQRDFLSDEMHEKLSNEFERIKALGLTEHHSRSRFSRFEGYDCYNYCIPPQPNNVLDWFWSPQLRDYFSALFGLPLSHDLVASLHHHLPGSQTGWIHNDYVTYPFQNRKLPNGMNPYFLRKNQPVNPEEVTSGLVYRKMRSIVMIYFLNNEIWNEGDGGETALFTTAEANTPSFLAAPHANSAIAFEISPESFHAFQKNVKHERNSIIIWFHTDTDTKIALHDGKLPVF